MSPDVFKAWARPARYVVFCWAKAIGTSTVRPRRVSFILNIVEVIEDGDITA
jgi:hypothetical protein